MPTLLDLAAQLTGEIPGLPRLFAQKYVNKALEDIRKDRLWSWNMGEGILITPGAVSGGTVAVTQFSNEVTFDSTAQAILTPLALANPPLIKRQFRVGGGSPIYNILGYDDSTGIVTLDRIYTEATNASATYQIYRCYYDPPSVDGITPNTDFLRYLSILNPIQGYVISGRRLYLTRETLNRRDPLRGAQGQPYYAATYRPTPNGFLAPGQTDPTAGQMQYELWPHPTSQAVLQCNYVKRHVDLSPADYLPAQLPSTLVVMKAFEAAYRWALQNQGRIPELRGTDWRFLLADSQKRYRVELMDAKRNDNEIMVTILSPGAQGTYGFQGPIDSNYAQSHGVAML